MPTNPSNTPIHNDNRQSTDSSPGTSESILLDDQGSTTTFNEPKEKPKREWFPHLKQTWFTYYHKHRNQVVYAPIGLLLAAGFLLLGFWPTLLLAVFILIGVIYGRYKDGNRDIRNMIEKLLERLD